VRIANEHMARALRVISVERGYDPADYSLLCFGGAGGLHACDLAGLLNMKRIIIPARAGVLSAVGMLVSEPGRELSSAVLTPLDRLTDRDIGEGFHSLEAEATAQLSAEGYAVQDIRFKYQLELRYRGQSATIPVNWRSGDAHAEAFHVAHEKASGLRLSHTVELVNIRLGARAPAVLKSVDIKPKYDGSLRDNMIYMPELDAEVPIYHRGALTMEGPMLLTESAATAWVQPGWMVEADQWGNVFLQLIE